MSSTENSQLSRICVSLQSDEKGRRKRSIEELHVIVRDEKLSNFELAKIWKVVNKQLSRCLTDEMEFCRNTSIEIWKIFLTKLPIEEGNIVQILPILSRRLSCQELLESSEEVRLNCVKLLLIVVEGYVQFLTVYYDDIVGILARTVIDNYPEVKRESCRCIEEISRAIPEQFYSRSTTLVKPVLSNFQHQHWKVRVASVRAIGEILINGNGKSIEDVATPMAERLFDQSGAVRLAVIEVAGRWLLELRDRYSWWHKLLPLLVTGLHDEIANIRNRAGELWHEAGELYSRENENDEKFKDKLDFLIEDPKHYPPNVKRPNLGCRVIVQQNLVKLVTGITRELGDWLADIRVRSAQLLCVLVLNAEAEVTQHIEKLLPAMYRACNDEDSRVVVNVELAAEYMGYFVPPEIYCHLVLPTLEETISSGHLRLFAAILRGSERETLCPKLLAIGHFIQQSHVCRSKKTKYQKQLARCCESLLRVSKSDCREISQELFTVLFTLVSTCQEDDALLFVDNLLRELAMIEEFSEIDELFVAHLAPILKDLEDSCQAWTIYSPELQIFRVCLTRASLATSFHTDVVLTILRKTTNVDSDPEVRLKLFIILADYFQRREVTLRHVAEKKNFVDTIVRDVILPGLVWSAGRAAEAIRTAAICCLCALLDDNAKRIRDFSSGNVIADGNIAILNGGKNMKLRNNEKILVESCEKKIHLEKSTTNPMGEESGEKIQIQRLESAIDTKRSIKEKEIEELEKTIEIQGLEVKIDTEKLISEIESEEFEKKTEIKQLEDESDVEKSEKKIERYEPAVDIENTITTIEAKEEEENSEMERFVSQNDIGKLIEEIEIEESERKIDIEKSELTINTEKSTKVKDIEESKKKIDSGKLDDKFQLFTEPDDFSEIFGKIVPILVSLVDDNAKKTRLYAIRAICLMIEIAKKLSVSKDDHIHEIYPIFLKRLDDGCDDVRIVAIEALVVIWGARTKNYDIDFSRGHIDFLYTTAIVHLDDPDKNFQSLMLDAFFELAKVHPELLAKKIENCRGNFRNQTGLDKLFKHCHKILGETK